MICLKSLVTPVGRSTLAPGPDAVISNKSLNSFLVLSNTSNILFAATVPSSAPILFIAVLITCFFKLLSKGLVKSPSNNVSSNNFKNCFLSSTLDVFNNFLYSGNIVSICLSILATISSEKLVSRIVLPVWTCFAFAISSGLVPLNLNADASLSSPLAIIELLYANSFPLVANALIAWPPPYTKGASNADSAPNFNLFNNFLSASSAAVALTSLSNSVGPDSKRSPKVPIFSLSTTNVSPAAPPNAMTPYLLAPVILLYSSALSKPFLIFLFFGFTSLPAFFAFINLLAIFSAPLIAALAPTVPNVPIWVNASDILPVALSCASSSKGFIVSKNFSTSAA